MAKFTFEDVAKAKEFEQLLKEAGIYDKEVLKRYLGQRSSLLGKGRTKTKYLESTLKLLINVFIREPMEVLMKDVTPVCHDDHDKNNGEEHPDPPTEKEEDHSQEDEFIQVQHKKLCKHWTKNRCKPQDKCKFRHPDLCHKFSKFGPQGKLNPKGCNNQCGLFHPRDKWCFNAVRTGECRFGKDCKFEHFRGVRDITKKIQRPMTEKRHRTERRMGQEQNPSSRSLPKPSYAQVTKSEENSFLGKACLGMIERVLTRLETLENKPQ